MAQNIVTEYAPQITSVEERINQFVESGILVSIGPHALKFKEDHGSDGIETFLKGIDKDKAKKEKIIQKAYRNGIELTVLEVEDFYWHYQKNNEILRFVMSAVQYLKALAGLPYDQNKDIPDDDYHIGLELRALQKDNCTYASYIVLPSRQQIQKILVQKK
ncbi:MAG: hypothetical protein ACOYT4_03925 [Nanoarchaeota archaeon]